MSTSLQNIAFFIVFEVLYLIKEFTSTDNYADRLQNKRGFVNNP